jgi:hypothetical protein
MIDLPAGASGAVSGNQIVQGKNKDNHSAFIAIAAEGREHSSNDLAITGNRASFAPGVERNSTFIADWSGDRMTTSGNTLASGISLYQRR